MFDFEQWTIESKSTNFQNQEHNHIRKEKHRDKLQKGKTLNTKIILSSYKNETWNNQNNLNSVNLTNVKKIISNIKINNKNNINEWNKHKMIGREIVSHVNLIRGGSSGD